MAGRKWTSEEIIYIKSNYINMTCEEMSKFLPGRTTRAIQHMFGILGLERPLLKPGDKFGRYTILDVWLEPRYGQNTSFAKVKCECGTTKKVRLSRLKPNKTVSCGCWKRDKAREKIGDKNNSYKHGKGSLEYRLYRIWNGMKSRCYCENTPQYNDYGGRGIKVCDEWRYNFVNFENWALNNGYNDSLSIDRINVNGNYEPSNCRWATFREQAMNRRNNIKIILTAFGETKSVHDWVLDKRCCVDGVNVICYRLGAGWPAEKSITTPSERGF